MTHREWAQWVAYVETYGPIDIQRRYDEPAARVAAVVAQVNGSRHTAEHFLPYRREKTSIDSGTLVTDPDLAKHFSS